MALAGTLLAGASARAQAHTTQVSVQEAIMRLHIEMSRQRSLIDNMEKLKTAYEVDPKSPQTQKLKAAYCGGPGPSMINADADKAGTELIERALPPFVQGVPEGTQVKVSNLGTQQSNLSIRVYELLHDLDALGVTCPAAPPAQAEPLAESGALGTAKPSAENPLKGQMMLAVYFVLGLALYFLPSVVGDRKRNRWAIFTLNLLLGWTILGWIGALVWALCAEPSVKPVLSHSTNAAMIQNAFCGHCGSPVTTEFCRKCGRRAATGGAA